MLNSDLKIYAKVLARRIQDYLPELINCDQTGFIKSRLAADNVGRLLHVIDAASVKTEPAAVLSLVAMKALDRLEWAFLWSVLEKMIFVWSRYCILTPRPTVQLSSTLFPVNRSSRQGCPLSLALIALSLEPLAQMICQSPIL